MMMLHVLMLVRGRMLLFILVDNGLLLVRILVLSLMVLLVLWQLPVVVRGHPLMLLMVGGGLQLMVLLLLVHLVVGVLHVRFLHFMVLVGGPLFLRLLSDIEMMMVGRLVLFLLVV
jgi:hypothetical protein